VFKFSSRGVWRIRDVGKFKYVMLYLFNLLLEIYNIKLEINNEVCRS
jgi:hypothetical protein